MKRIAVNAAIMLCRIAALHLLLKANGVVVFFLHFMLKSRLLLKRINVRHIL